MTTSIKLSDMCRDTIRAFIDEQYSIASKDNTDSEIFYNNLYKTILILCYDMKITRNQDFIFDKMGERIQELKYTEIKKPIQQKKKQGWIESDPEFKRRIESEGEYETVYNIEYIPPENNPYVVECYDKILYLKEHLREMKDEIKQAKLSLEGLKKPKKINPREEKMNCPICQAYIFVNSYNTTHKGSKKCFLATQPKPPKKKATDRIRCCEGCEKECSYSNTSFMNSHRKKCVIYIASLSSSSSSI